jgi:hypothetical protein
LSCVCVARAFAVQRRRRSILVCAHHSFTTTIPPNQTKPNHKTTGDIECLAEVARCSSHGMDGLNEYDDAGQTAL